MEIELTFRQVLSVRGDRQRTTPAAVILQFLYYEPATITNHAILRNGRWYRPSMNWRLFQFPDSPETLTLALAAILYPNFGQNLIHCCFPCQNPVCYQVRRRFRNLHILAGVPRRTRISIARGLDSHPIILLQILHRRLNITAAAAS